MEEKPASPPQSSDAQDFTIAQSRALVPLLVMFGLTVLVIVVSILKAEPFEPPEGGLANKAFRPADFPAVFAKDESLAGLDQKLELGKLYQVPPPPFQSDLFPCMDCHEAQEPNPVRRELTDNHTDIVLKHDEEHRWCLDCHDLKDRNRLRLANGTLVEFTESYKLCGQCHGTQYRDWRSGIHGKRTGYWDGAKRYLLCVNCHYPHAPHFKALQPLPPPVRPQFLAHGDEGAEPPAEATQHPAKKEDGHAKPE